MGKYKFREPIKKGLLRLYRSKTCQKTQLISREDHFQGARCKILQEFQFKTFKTELRLSTEYEVRQQKSEVMVMMLCHRHLCVVLQRYPLKLASAVTLRYAAPQLFGVSKIHIWLVNTVELKKQIFTQELVQTKSEPLGK